MRLFLAVNLEPRLRRAVFDATEPLRALAPDASWASEPKIHLTLKFLGEQRDDLPARLRDAVHRVGAAHRPFDVALDGVGAFPNFRRARVVWLGIEREPRLELLHHDLEEACATVGLDLDGRPYHPHLTLARIRERTSEESLRALARAARRIEFRDTFPIRSIDLMHSDLSSAGSAYTMEWSAPLRSD